MTAVDVDALDKLREALPAHQSWCHGEAHAECCGAGDCDCGVADSLARLLPVVDRIANERAAAELRAAAADVDDGEFSSRESARARALILDRADRVDPS